MALTKISRGLLNTGVSDSSDANAITISSAEKVTVANSLNAPTSIQTPLIEFTDGDDAIAIADGGAVTMAKVGAIGATTAGTGAFTTLTTSSNLTVGGNLTVTGTSTVVDTVTMNAQNAVIFEGATADNYETTLSIVDPTADHTQYLINQDGYIPVLAAVSTTAITSTPAELNIVDGGTSATSTTLADADRLVVNDNGTMVQVALTDLETYMETSLDTLSNVTSLGTLTTLTVDNVIVNGTTIGHTSDTDLMTLASDNLTITGDITQATGDYLYSGGGNFDIKHTIASQNITFYTRPSGGSATERMRVTHDGKLGIGTSSIDSNIKLQIEDSAYPLIAIDRSSLSADGNHLGYINFQSNGDVYGRIGAWVEDLSETDGELRFSTQKGTSLADQMVITSDGYVGIGESAPTNLLHVKVSDAGINPHTSAQLVLERSGTNYLQFLTAADGTSGILFGDTNDYDTGKIVYDHNIPAMQFVTENSERMRITSDGNVNVSTGQIQMGGTAIFGSDRKLTNTVGAYFTGNVGINVNNPSEELNIRADSGHIRLSSATTTTKGLALIFDNSNNRSEIRSDQQGVNQLDLMYYALDHHFGRNSSSITMSLTDDNKVGIGTASPAQVLHVSGTGRFDDSLYFTTRGIISWGSIGGGTGFGIRGESGNGLSLGSNGAWDKMIIDTSGNVGIGITSPDQALDVGGYIVGGSSRTDNSEKHMKYMGVPYHSSDTSNIAGMYINGHAGGNYIRIGGGVDATSAATQISFHTAALTTGAYEGTTRMRIKDDGYIEMAGAADLRVTIGSQGTAGNNDSNWIRASNAVMMYNSASDDHRWEIGGTETMRIDANASASVGHLQLKDTHPWIDMIAPDGAYWKSGITMRGGSSSTQAQAHFHMARHADYKKLSTAGDYDAYISTTSSSTGYGNLLFGTRDTEAMRIETDQDIVIGGGTEGAAGTITFYKETNFVNFTNNTNSSAGNGTEFQTFRRNGTQIGSIVMNGTTGTTYATSSDYRLKENVDYSWDATTRLKQLKPARFNWISDETNTLQDGFLAHEVSSIVPEAVSGDKDAMETYTDDNDDEQTRIKPQQLDHSKLVPLLVKAIQEQQEQIEELKARIATLEG